jgi:hypothetical protein
MGLNMLKLEDDYIKYVIIKIEKLEELLDGMLINYYGKLIMKKDIIIKLHFELTNSNY